MFRRVVLLSLCLALLPVGSSAIDPDNMTPQEYTLIEQNCQAAQRSMQRIKYVDPVMRVNRGATYSSITNLMAALTNRAAYNAFRVPQLSQETNAVQTQRVQFANDYTDYEIALSDLVNYDCKNNPSEFYKRLVDVRTKRSIVALRIREIDQRLDAFTVATTELTSLIRLQVNQ